MRLKDPYEVLGLDASASASEIKAAYRKLARERHPDGDLDNPWAADEFKDLAEAYALLSDPKTRARYDRGDFNAQGRPAASGAKKRTARKPAGRGASGPAGKTKGAKRTTVKIDGADVEYDLTVDFTEAAKGCVKHVTMTNGKRLKVSIPAGTDDGALLRLKDQGMPGIGGGSSGDAHVSVAVTADPVFRRDDADIHVDLAISLPEAVLGGKIEAPTIDGPVSVTVPKNANAGTMLRLKGKGLAKGPKGGGPRGDQYVTLNVVLPRKPDRAFVEFITEWSKENDYEVRKKPGRK